MASPVTDTAWLAWIERMVEGTAVSARAVPLPRSGFHCRLDDQPDHLVPTRHFEPGQWEGSTGRYILNPDCRIYNEGTFPDSVCCEDLKDFCFASTMVWLADPATQSLQPFWLGRAVADAIHNLQPGDTAPTLPPHLFRILRMANLLIEADFVATRCQIWLKTVSRCRPSFQQRGFAPVGDLIHPFHVSALRRYYRNQIRTGKLHLGDDQTPLRFARHNDSVARFFHRQLTHAVCELTGERLKPSYVYLGSYQAGATLEKHIDREQCEVSLSFCLDYSPEPRLATPWPLTLHTENGTVSIFQSLGDALLYRGRVLPHSRGPLPEEHTSTSIFFHYVAENFAGPLE